MLTILKCFVPTPIIVGSSIVFGHAIMLQPKDLGEVTLTYLLQSSGWAVAECVGIKLTKQSQNT